MWTNENGRSSVVLKSDIFTNEANEKLIIGKEYTVRYGNQSFKGVLKMISMKLITISN